MNSKSSSGSGDPTILTEAPTEVSTTPSGNATEETPPVSVSSEQYQSSHSEQEVKKRQKGQQQQGQKQQKGQQQQGQKQQQQEQQQKDSSKKKENSKEDNTSVMLSKQTGVESAYGSLDTSQYRKSEGSTSTSRRSYLR